MDEVEVLLVENMKDIPISADEIRQAQVTDILLGKVREYVHTAWPNPKTLSRDFAPYLTKRHEFSFERGILLWGNRVVIRPVFQTQLLQRLHKVHHGIVKMKAVAKRYFW